MSTLDSNMASEFLVMSELYRLGLSPILTLGNKKEIDIVIQKVDRTITIDVKGLKGTTNWPIGTREKLEHLSHLQNHFFCFVCYHNRFSNLSESPEIYIVPVQDTLTIAQPWRGQNQFVVFVRDLRRRANEFQDKWSFFFD
jgi:hypothetical protein